MNLLNPHTIVLITGLLAGMLAMVLLVMRRSFPPSIQGFGEWATAVLLFFVTGPLFAIGDPATETLRISIANTVLMSGIYLCYVGTQRFFGVTPKLVRGWSLLAVVCLVLAWFALIDNRYAVRLAITSALQIYLFCRNAWLVYRHGLHTFPRMLLTCVLASAALLQIIRYGASLTNPNMVGLLDNTVVQVSYVLTYPFIMLLFSISTILLAFERLRDELERMSNHDPLTGLLNRRAFELQAQSAWARRSRQPQPLSALAFDLDHFKVVNDTYGHNVGDIVLVHVARVLRDMARETDIVARLGGEEFVIIMPGASGDQAFAVAERICALLAQEAVITPDGQSLRISSSVGLAAANSDDANIRAVLERADKALYEAKRTGRNRICRALEGVASVPSIENSFNYCDSDSVPRGTVGGDTLTNRNLN